MDPLHAFSIPNGIVIGSAVSAQLTAENPYTLQRVTPSPSQLPCPMGDLDPRLIHGSTPCIQHPERHRDRFSRFCTAHGRGSLYFTIHFL